MSLKFFFFLYFQICKALLTENEVFIPLINVNYNASASIIRVFFLLERDCFEKVPNK